MSEAAKKALINARDWNQGTRVMSEEDVQLELRRAGLVTEFNNLTRKGSIAAERLQRAQLEELFPL